MQRKKSFGTAVQRMLLAVPLSMLLVVVAACNPNSEAVSVLESENRSMRATLTAFKDTAMTMTAQSTAVAQRMGTMQSQLTAVNAQLKDQTARDNAVAAQATLPPAQVSQATPNLNNGGAGGSNTQAAPTGFAFVEVVTARRIDSDGCAASAVTTFSTNDSRIYVVADVRNFKSGTNFTAKWAGNNLSREDSWKARSGSAKLCIYFYIEPKTLELQAGSYTVTLSATGLESSPIQFTVEGTGEDDGDQMAATAAP
jgi:hypothetical protein